MVAPMAAVHIMCMSHTLQIAVTAGLKECHGVINVILIAPKIIGFVHRSDKAVNKHSRLPSHVEELVFTKYNMEKFN